MNAVEAETPVLKDNSPEVSETPKKQSFIDRIGSLFGKNSKPEPASESTDKPKEPLPYKIPSLEERKEGVSGDDLYHE